LEHRPECHTGKSGQDGEKEAREEKTVRNIKLLIIKMRRRKHYMVRKLAVLVIVLSVAAIVIGGIFIGEGVAKNNLIVDRMKVEKVTLAVDPNNPKATTQINNASDAQKAADTIAGHRRGIALSYQELLNKGTGKFDPANPTDLTYAQAMNLENYLYMAVTAFGLIQVTMASGAFMVIVGVAIGCVGLALMRLGKTAQA
jgi:hypothetical protein